MNELLTYVQTNQRPIKESLEDCGLDPSEHENDPLDVILALAKKEINVFPFSDVRPCWFQLYTDVSIAKAAHHLSKLNPNLRLDSSTNSDIVAKTVGTLDHALIIAGGGHENTKEIIYAILRRLDSLLYPSDDFASSEDEVREDEADSDLDNHAQTPPPKRRRLNTDAGSQSSPLPRPLPENLAFVPKIRYHIPRLDRPSLETFQRHVHQNGASPILLENTLTHWPATRRWHDAKYWLRRTLNGRRLVPVEIGQSYTDTGWRQEIMPFSQFLEDFIMKGDQAEEIGYLAQHDLFRQIPELNGDIAVPDYCYADMPSTGEGAIRNATVEDNPTPKESDNKHKDEIPCVHQRHANGQDHDDQAAKSSTITQPPQPDSDLDPDSVSVPPSPSPSPSIPTIHKNIWFGSRTVSPLHHDPHHNILAQIHGHKYVRLYSPAQTPNLYPRSSREPAPHTHTHIPSDAPPAEAGAEAAGPTIDMSNTSAVDLWSLERSPCEDWAATYPALARASYVEAVLPPGHALFVPRGWWHYVRCVSGAGVSVSFWW